MSFLSKLFDKFLPEIEEEEEEIKEVEAVDFDHSNLSVHNSLERRRYIEGCLEQMRDAALKVEELNEEYNVVNSYLRDMEIIDSIGDEERLAIEEHARALGNLNVDKQSLAGRKSYMDEADFRRMERLGDEVVDAIKTLSEAEDYQGKIKRDLSKLEAEKHAYKYRMEEARVSQGNIRGMAVICLISAIACVAILIILQFMLSMDATVGYLIMAVMVAVILTAMFVRFKDADKEYRVSANGLNKIILLQNTVKIRYVNNTNLLDYLYLKYNVSGAKKLKELWEKYQVELGERERLRETEADLSYHGERLVAILKKYRLYDPVIWVKQYAALLDPREMVEIRHELILRRQSLRKQTEYNKQNASTAKEEVMTVAREYPAYAEEIMDMLTQKL